MVTDDFLCIKEVTKVVNLTLPSMYNTNEISGICNALESWKRQYVKQLQGIVVGYKNVSLQSKRGFIKIDCPMIFCNVKATFELFYPTIGSIIKGKVNRISQDHIGCLVHDTINVTVHRTADVSSDISKFIILDHYILFQITRINFKSKFIHVKGKITEECITLMKESGLLIDNTAISNSDVLTCASPDFLNDNNSSIIDNNPLTLNNNTQEIGSLDTSTDTSSQSYSHKKKKKHKKSKESFSASPSLISKSLENDIDQIELTQSRKRKRKMSDVNSTSLSDALENDTAVVPKKKIKTEEFNAIDVNHLEFTGTLDTSTDTSSQTSSHKKKKKHKKSKESFSMSPSLISESLENDIHQIELTQTPKKKRKKSDVNSTSSSNVLENETAVSPKKKIKTEDFNTTPSPQKTPPSSHIKSEYESLTSPDLFDGPLNQDEGDEKPIKSKKKKKKDKVTDKSKLKKKKKDKLKKGSKKDKKGSKKDKKKKIKVISTKKKLHGHSSKLKKNKNKDKNSKVNKKNKVKSEKTKCVPE